MKFPSPPGSISFPETERAVMKRWEDRCAFERSIEQRSRTKNYSFYDGPPFATGLPHYGHLLVSTIKDVVPRYWTMRGYRVERRFGWDCHGLPIEFEVEKQLGLNGRSEIEEYGVDKFNETCRSIVLRYAEEWRTIVTRMGRWVDFENDYKTMDVSFMESVWHVFKTLWDKNLIYEGYRVVPYSWRIGAPLSNFEANLNYKDVQDPSITVKFQLDDGLCGTNKTFVLAWTTTPWTLPSNVALAIDPQATYTIVEVNAGEKNSAAGQTINEGAVVGEHYVLHADLVASYWPEGRGIERIGELKGSDLVGCGYQPLFPFFAGRKDSEENAFKILPADFVTAETGTGIVHMAPAFGEDDFRLGKAFGLEPSDPVDEEGKFTEAVPSYQGQMVKDADKQIIIDLKEQAKLLRHETYDHSYPFCYRSDTPLIYKTITAWYVRVEEIKDDLVSNNQEVRWVPGHLKDGRMGKWLEGARDWNISRNRYWGNPLPIWRNEETGETICIGSRAELEELSGQKVGDLHKHIVDDIVIPAPSGNGELRRIPEVLDCWFESGSMPYGQAHYPFENKEQFKQGFPADFICEALDQTRGWFYTLLVLSTALFKKPAFENCVVNGLLLAEDGRKMSKSLKNYPEPSEMLEKYGADAIRIYMLNSPALRGEELRFAEEGVREMVRRVLLPWWNSVSFLMTYAAVDEWDPETQWYTGDPTHELDVWINAKLEELKRQVEQEMAEYRLYRVVDPLLHFLDDLTNWYIRRSRRRFWKSEHSDDKLCAYTTLYSVLLEFTELMAPFTPFIADEVYELLRVTPETQAIDSVHLRDLPLRRELSIEEYQVERRIDLTRTVCELGRSLREKARIRTRQPLVSVKVGTTSSNEREWLQAGEGVILEELNIKRLEILDDPTKLATPTVKPNMSRLGPRFGKEVKMLAKTLATLQEVDAEKVRQLAFGESTEVDGHLLDPQDVHVEMEPSAEGELVATSGKLVVSIDSHITEELRYEGLARDLINRVQKMRKDAGMQVSDRIYINISSEGPSIIESTKQNDELIRDETLGLEKIRIGEAIPNVEIERATTIEGEEVTIQIGRDS
ncbi:MAG: isoleucine--tRNA ligase [Acidobacteriota bacterium]|jgi:isoleucyl-tRNA synthetase|nr:isoleucine--tRNA ligase [Acidobacteriota bacterium]